MLTIHLHNLQFFSFHGLHPEEKLLGGTFTVDVDLFINTTEQIARLTQTVDYTVIFGIIKKRMEQPTDLLETVAQDLVYLISKADGQIKKIHVSIIKNNPPIGNFDGNVGISFDKEF